MAIVVLVPLELCVKFSTDQDGLGVRRLIVGGQMFESGTRVVLYISVMSRRLGGIYSTQRR